MAPGRIVRVPQGRDETKSNLESIFMRLPCAWERTGAVLRPLTRILNSSDDSRFRNRICRADGAGLWQLSERVPYALARWREHREAALSLPQLRTRAGVVGECAAD